MYEYTLEYAEFYVVPEPLTKNRTCQSYRWKQLAMCNELEPLEEMLKPYMRIIDKSLNVVRKHCVQFR